MNDYKISTPLRFGDIELGGRVLVAPMTGVTDLPYRLLTTRLGAAYVATEMVACAEFARGAPMAVRRAAVGEGLGLMVVQLVGAEPEMIARGAELAARAGAQIIDLNFGCPAKSVSGHLCGSALSFIVSISGFRLFFRMFSRIRSKMTTVSLTE